MLGSMKRRRSIAHTVYALTDPRTNDIKYVGVTSNMQERLARHLKREDKGKKSDWIQELQELGLQPQMEILEQVSLSDDPFAREQYWIQYCRQEGYTLFNRKPGTESFTKIAKWIQLFEDTGVMPVGWDLRKMERYINRLYSAERWNAYRSSVYKSWEIEGLNIR